MKGEEELLKLQKLVKSLKSAEIEVIKKLIEHSKSNYLKVNKQDRLLFLLLNKENLSYLKIKNLVSKEASDYSFNRLISRLKDRVIESLYLDVNINRGTNMNSAFRNRLKQKKLMVSAFVLHSRGMIEQSMELYNEVIGKSKIYELYDDLLEALYMKQGLIGLSKGIDAYEKISQEITFFEDCRIEFYNAKDWYRSFYAEVDFKGLRSVDYHNKLKKYINQLQISYNRTASSNVRMYQYLLEMEMYQQLEDFDNVDKEGQEFVAFVRKSKAIYGKERVGSIYSQLAENKIKSYDFIGALEYCKEGIKYFKNKNLNYYGLKELEVEAYYYLGSFNELEKMILKLSEESFYQQFDYRRTKLRYYLGMVYFLKGEFKKAKFEFNDTREIEKDKEGWNIWIRIMRILCDVEMERYNLIDYDIDSFRRYIYRISQRRDVRGRDEIILKTLVTLEKKSFNFNKSYKSDTLLFSQLELMNDKNRWKVDSPELIIYHQWFVAKVENKDYKPNFDRYRSFIKDQLLQNIKVIQKE